VACIMCCVHCAADAESSASPLVKWAQRRNALFLTIPLGTGEGRGLVRDEKVLFEKHGRLKVDFTATARTGGGREKYELDLLLHGPINPKKSVWTLGVRGFDIVVEKSKLAMWPRLTQTKAKLPHITIDWDRWQDDDDGMGDEDDEDADQDEEEEEEEPDEDNDLWPGEAPANKEL